MHSLGVGVGVWCSMGCEAFTHIYLLITLHRYSWLFYINPNFYGFSAMARVLLQDIDLGCQYDSPIECFPSSGAYLLTYFDLHRTNPYLNVVVSLLFLN